MSHKIAIQLIVLLTVVFKCEEEVRVVPIELHSVPAIVDEPWKIPPTLKRYSEHVREQLPDILLSKSSAFGALGTERTIGEDGVHRARELVAIGASPSKALLCTSVWLLADEGSSDAAREAD